VVDPDAHEIADTLRYIGVKLALGASLYAQKDPLGKMFFNVLITFTEFKGDLIGVIYLFKLLLQHLG